MITPVSQVMSRKLLTIALGSSLQEAQGLMNERRIRHLPVVDDNDNIVGVISQKDIRTTMNLSEATVDMVMASPVESVAQNTSLRQAILQMLQKKISCLLVADESSNAVGIVTTDDLLWHLAHILAHESEERPMLTAMDRQTIGEVANELATMGI